MALRLGLSFVVAFVAACGARTGLDIPGGRATPSGEILLFGGSRGGFVKPLGDTWTFDGTAWSELSPSHSPSARSRSMYAALGGRGVLFGGLTDAGTSAFTGETWLWNGADWSQASPAHSPSAREGGAMTTLGDRIVLFSGYTGGAPVNDTWTWDGSDWTQHPSAPNDPVWRNTASFATLGDRAVLFGGYGEASQAQMADVRNDTWTWDGSTWTEVHPAHSPSARQGAAMAALGDRIVLFGGSGGNGVLADTWTWDGLDWSSRAPAHAPSARVSAMAAALDGKLYLHGGFDPDRQVPDAVWQWDGVDWTELAVSGPGTREVAAFVAVAAH